MDLISRACAGIASRGRAWWLRMRGLRIQGKIWLRAVEIPRNHRNISLETGVALDRGVVLLVSGAASNEARITIGRNTYINRYAIIDASELISIGAECMIGPFCYITDHDHVAGPGIAPGQGELLAKATVLEDRCWLGAHVTILKGVTIGSGTVVGAGSIVTHSLPANVVAVGNPARIIKNLS